MNPFLSHLHAELRRARLTRRGATNRPEEVPRSTHKTYPRMPHVSLPNPTHSSTTLAEALTGRASTSTGDPEKPISLQEIGTLLGLSLRERANRTRNYPSGGALYPVETYLISTALETQIPAAFHYDPTGHTLERLWDLPPDFDMKRIAAYPTFLPVSAMIVFTGVWQRSSAKYGDLAYLHTLIEAGHMSENILLVATALDLGARPYAGFNDDLIVELLGLDPEGEQPVHSVTLCKGKMTSRRAEPGVEE